MASIDLQKVKLLVVGDSGVGKSSLVHLICHDRPIFNTSYTIGASVDVKIHEYKEGTLDQKTCFIEFWDIGGAVNHANSRHIFYSAVNGIILVHDLTNRKSHANLGKWLSEILQRDHGNSSERHRSSVSEYDPERFAGHHTPILVVGAKKDQLDAKRQNSLQSSSIAEECGADEVNLNCIDSKHLAPGTTNAVKFSRFFDKVISRRCGNNSRDSPKKVIERRYFPRDTSQATSTQERRRISTAQQMKSLHTD
ncbi:rab-like protein 3 isoform X1 [Diadema setosum]|uniref:rab-like protein 3 isoform X1 n=1 Tax=Diadema antillarum TaxID=105358 RepID=UPI003A84E104